jgi:3-deoxy-D-arabino-heptulosonate 7-phosphate (DAHP) synthase class II
MFNLRAGMFNNSRIEQLESEVRELKKKLEKIEEDQKILVLSGDAWHLSNYHSIPVVRVVNKILEFLNVKIEYKYPEEESISLVEKKEPEQSESK